MIMMSAMSVMLTSTLCIHLAAIVAFVIISAGVPVGEGASVDLHLPKTAADFFSSHSCNKDMVLKSLEINEEDDAFFRWVLSARHTTWQPGWEVAIPRYNNTMPTMTDTEGEKYYARVFDLLNWSRNQNLLPVQVSISSICHKGMETQYDKNVHQKNWASNNNLPAKPNAFIPVEMWSNLWNTCHKQLSSTSRTSSSCIDIPGIIVANPSPPWKPNNPCSLEYRMVDGAHRKCLRQYLLALLTGELNELEESPSSKFINDKIQQKQSLIKQTSRHGLFLVLNQSTFESMLMSSDPHTTWAKTKELLMKDVPEETKLEWRKWMERVMDHALKGKSNEMGSKDEL